MSRKRISGLLLILILCAALVAGCGSVNEVIDSEKEQSEGGTPAKGVNWDEEHGPAWDQAADNRVGNVAFRKAEAAGRYHFDPEGKAVFNGVEEAGRWIKTDEKTFGEENPCKWDVWRSGIEDAYEPGGVITADLTIRIEGKDKIGCEEIWGAMYFADLNGTDGDIGSDLIVREYFSKAQNEDTYPAVEMSHFARDNDGRSGDAEGSDGDLEYYYDTRCAFPRLTSEGDRICCVLDIHGEDNRLVTRYLWEYTFQLSEPEKETEDDGDHENDPDYYSIEHPGHWILSDIKYIGGDGEPVKDGDMTITAERYGTDGRHMICTFEGADGSYHRVRLQDIKPDPFVYAEGDYLYLTSHAYSYMEPAGAPGLVHCSVALGEEEPESFDAPSGHGAEDEDPLWNGDLTGTSDFLEISFPAGKKTGDTICLYYGMEDGFSGNVQMYNVYEYTYTEGPDLEWIYSEPMPD